MLVRNHSDLEISLIRAKAKLVFRNFKERAQDEGELDFDIGIKIPPTVRKYATQTYGQNMKILMH